MKKKQQYLDRDFICLIHANYKIKYIFITAPLTRTKQLLTNTMLLFLFSMIFKFRREFFISFKTFDVSIKLHR